MNKKRKASKKQDRIGYDRATDRKEVQISTTHFSRQQNKNDLDDKMKGKEREKDRE